jgi:pimeloyl-ACP methyl ester carboxylesterase
VTERFCDVGDIRLCYETFGEEGAPTLVLIMGLATQMLGWHEGFCAELAGRGFHVVRFDNRDIGRSSRVPGRPPTAWQLVSRDPRAAHYTLADMAADTVGLLDHLGVERADVVGASMGGMIAQSLAARHPQRVASLVSIMSSTGHRWTGQPRVRLLPVLLRRAPREKGGWVDHFMRVFQLIGSPGYPGEEGELRDMLARAYERGHDAAGPGRQLAAIIVSGDRSAEVRSIRAPTLVIHGTADRLVAPSGGRRTAALIPGARLELIEGMGHDLPRAAWPRIVDGIVDNARRAGAPATTAAT